ncbi:MAG: hypothetical protein GY782_05360 [Gammaproteobacteria bacterium]|nr:hypothetical protein [Gammaproteobacteria bacterium]
MVKQQRLTSDSPDTPVKTTTKHLRGMYAAAHPTVASIIKCEDKVQKIAEAEILNHNGEQLLDAFNPQDPHEVMLMQHMQIAQEWMGSCMTQASQYFTAGYAPHTDKGIKLATLGAKFMALYTRQLETLDRHRQMTQSPPRTGTVQVNQGGQAIVGDVTVNQREEK